MSIPHPLVALSLETVSTSRFSHSRTPEPRWFLELRISAYRLCGSLSWLSTAHGTHLTSVPRERKVSRRET